MKEARAIRKRGFTHTVEVRGGDHVLTADESRKDGGNDEGPSPQELLAASPAARRAGTQGLAPGRSRWSPEHDTVEVKYEPAQRGSPTRFEIAVKLPKELPEDQRERLMQIVARCPVHRTLEGEVIFDEKLELV
jgi:putative redox protein